MEINNYYKDDELLAWLGSRVFYEDEHFGRALTNEEINDRKKLEEEYKEEIKLAEAMLKANPNFVKLSLENKINLATDLVLRLKEISAKESNKQR